MNYQKTLNLPRTTFAMRAGLAQKEPQFLARWQKEGLQQRITAKAKGRPPFILHDGPPYANGHIHIGHALNKILKDMVVKMKTMQGFDSRYVPGWDCHGLPIEHQLFKKLGKRKAEVDTAAFRREAHAYALKFVDIQKEEFQRLGVFGEWDRPYLTLSPEYEYWILKSFARLVREGYVYRGLKPVNWCAECETALAEAEVEYEDHTSPSVYVKFRVNNPEALGLAGGAPLSLLIWTTTPWTLLANVAVAVHHKYRYSVINIGSERLVIEDSLKETVLAKSGIKESSVEKTLTGDALVGLRYMHPFQIKGNCPVITVDYVTREDGTGLVHTAPGHGQEDYEAGLAHNLDVVMPVDDRGIFIKDAGAFAGQHVFKANQQIIEDLKGRGMLAATEDIRHSYPHCWRCKQPVIFRATRQWFLNIDHNGLRGKLKDAVRRDVAWIPPAGLERILSMVTSRPDWCLSRQRHWGVPIPALADRTADGEHRLMPEVIEHFAELVRAGGGSDLWFTRELKDLLPQELVTQGRVQDFEKTFDILDVWFDSGVSHQAVIGPMLQASLPVQLYLEGSDQHRGWFQSSLIPAVALEGQPPFEAVLTHGFVVDGQGRKMSKSLGNVISPQELIKQNGADILRLWVAASNYHEDVRLSNEIMARVVDSYRKIRNTLRFILGNLADFDADRDVLPYQELQDIDKWGLNLMADVSEKIQTAYNAYEFAKVYKLIYAFCNEDLSGFYLDILKDRLYTSHALALERRSAQTVLFHIVNSLVRLLAPILAFTAEEVFHAMPPASAMQDTGSVHLLEWLEIPCEWRNTAVKYRFERLLNLRPAVLRSLEEQRKSGTIGSSLEARIVFASADPQELNYLRQLQDELPSLLIVSQVKVEEASNVPEGLSDQFSHTAMTVRKAEGEKCQRCWNYVTDVGKHPSHPDVCARCASVVERQVADAPLSDTDTAGKIHKNSA